MEAGDEDLRRLHLQRAQDVVARARIRGRGQRDARHAGELFGQAGQLAVLRAELVAPLRDAMRLVDREQRELQARQPLQRAVAQQPLGRDVQQIELLLDQVARDAARLGGIEIGMQRAGGHAELAQRRHLVVHQRDQRRDDHRGAGPAQRRDLVADALAAAGRHQHQRVAAGDDMAHHLLPAGRGSRGSRTRGAARLPDRPSASACTSDCSMRRSAPADADFHPPALLRGQRELHRAMAALAAPASDRRRRSATDRPRPARAGRTSGCWPALLPVGSAKPLTCATLPGCDFTHSAAWLITDCAASSIAADHSWKNTTNFCCGGSAARALPVAAHSSRSSRCRGGAWPIPFSRETAIVLPGG